MNNKKNSKTARTRDLCSQRVKTNDSNIYLPLDPYNWNPVVLWPMAVKVVVEIVVEVIVAVEVPHATRKRGLAVGALNPGSTTNGTTVSVFRAPHKVSTSAGMASVSTNI